jgi:hypothetical protein
MRAPLLATLFVTPPTGEGLRNAADGLVVGRLQSVAEGPTRSFGGTSLGRTIRVEIGEVTITRINGSGEQSGGSVFFEITVETVAENGPPKNQAVYDGIVTSAPVGSTVAAYLVKSSVGDFYQLAHPSGWAIVEADGTLRSLAVDHGGQVGLGGIAQRAALPI